MTAKCDLEAKSALLTWLPATSPCESLLYWESLSVNYLHVRWPDTIYFREGQLFWNQSFSCSTAFNCWDVLDAEKGMLEVYEKCTFIEIYSNLWKLSAILLNVVFKENAYYRENEKKSFLHITLNRTSKISGTKFQICRLHTTFIANGD